MADEIAITQRTRLTKKQTEQLRAILEESFPPAERGDFSELIDSIANGERWLFIASETDRIIGLAVILPSLVDKIHLLEYFAIKKNYRNRGLGAMLLKNLGDRFKQTGNVIGIVFEVESDEDGTPAERQLRTRRIAFYRRNGAQMIDCLPGHRVPNLARAGTLNMKLMWLPLMKSAGAISGARLCECITNIYTRSYALPSHHPLIAEALERVVC